MRNGLLLVSLIVSGCATARTEVRVAAPKLGARGIVFSVDGAGLMLADVEHHLAWRDLDAEFPAVAARRLGLSRVPLLCAREVPVPGSLARVIRVLVHYYAPEDHKPRHVYLGEARALRVDLESAQ